MAHRNRVDPFGEIVAIPQRGRWMGNRGILHRGTEVVRPWQHRNWIICETSYKGWRARQWADGHYTPLFFLDEAVAVAAGHRPCALCRRPRWNAWLEAWRMATGSRARRDEIDRRLHTERRDEARRQRRHMRPWRELPVGVLALLDDTPVRVDESSVTQWTPPGYAMQRSRPNRGDAVVLTPSISVDVLSAGYVLDE
jgi:hypothetical protein